MSVQIGNVGGLLCIKYGLDSIFLTEEDAELLVRMLEYRLKTARPKAKRKKVKR